MTDQLDSSSTVDKAPVRTRRARWVRLSLWALALCWGLTLALWLALHALILPRIDHFRGWVQTRVSQALAMEVVIGELQVQGNWLVPWLEASDVVLLNAQGHATLHLPRVVAALTPWSLLRGTVEQLVIDQPVLDVRRDEQGRVWIAGFMLDPASSDTAVSDWFFAQPEFIVRSGRVLWRDDLRHGPDGPQLVLEDVDLVVRNPLHRHELRVEFTPPETFGQRLSLRGRFTHNPLLRSGNWQLWSGELYAETAHLDLSHLRDWVSLPAEQQLEQGRGAVRLWLDVKQGQAVGLWADVDLQAVRVKLGQDLSPLGLRQVQGRWGATWAGQERSFETQDLRFDTDEGEHWPGGNVRLSWRADPAESGQLQAERLNLEALATIGERTPLPPALREVLTQAQPRGEVRQLHMRWQGLGRAGMHYSAKGQVQALHWRRLPHAAPPWSSLPGLAGATVDFEVSEHAGKARVQVREGSLHVPERFLDNALVLAEAEVQLAWQRQGDQLSVQFSQGRLGNDDLAGEFSGQWKGSLRDDAGPGTLDLTASLTRAQATAVHRYLPSALPASVRQYVRDAVLDGEFSKGKVRVRGDLAQFPFAQTQQGEFRIAAQLHQGRYAYAPAGPKALPWPALRELQGELVFERNGLHFKGSTRVDGAPQVLWQKVDARIADFDRARVEVTGEGRGALDDLLHLAAAGALADLVEHSLDKAQANGDAQYKLALDVPLDKPERTKLKGSVVLAGNDLQVMPGTPVLSRTSGTVQFTEQGFDLRNLKGRMLGGEVDLQGGLRFGLPQGDSPVQLRLRGWLTAEGLRQARELGFVAQLATRANGRTDYQASLGLRRNQPELLITSELKGMALNLPAPLGKSAASALPLRVETQLTKESLLPKSTVLQDQLRVSLGRVLALAYLRDLSQAEPRVLEGGVALGTAANAPVVMTPRGVTLNMQWSQLDLDAWTDVLTEWTGGSSVVTPLARIARASGERAKAIGGLQATSANAMDYVPVNMAAVADEVQVTHRILHRVAAGGTRVGDLWRINVSAQELNGAIELRPPSGNTPAQFYARLSHLVIPPSVLSEVDQMLTPEPTSIPALDVVVDDFTVRERKLGRLEVVAINRAGASAETREWVLNKFNLTAPEATLVASGNWAADAQQVRRTRMDFSLDIRDSGDLLGRFGMAEVVRNGEGKIEGQIGWRGSPLTPDYPSLNGHFRVQVESGQFLKTEPGVGRLLGVLNLQALPRRLALDFSDIFQQGFAFDFFRGDVRVDKGVAFTNNLQMKGVSAAALIEGSADLARETQELKVVVVPEINAGNVSLYLATINPLVGLTNYLAQLVLAKPLARAGTSEFRIDGSWSNPRVTKVD